MDFSSRQLRAFLLVAQHQNFTRAAEALFITPAGLSVLVRQFEEQLGFRLFDRTTRHVALTREGTELLPAVQRGVEELESAMSRAGARVKNASQTLSIGAGHLVAAYILPQAIKEFRSRRPELRITVVDDDPVGTLQRVRAGSLDMGVGSFARPASGVRHTLFFRFALMVIRPESESAPRRASTTWSALNGESLILPSLESVRSVIERHLMQARVSAPSTMVLNRLDTIVGMVEAGQGTAVVPSYAHPACQHRRVVMTRLTNPIVPIEFFQIRNRGRKLPPVAEEFATFLQAHIARWAGRAGLP
jgi:LysR family transcriptional regulator, carnitine catabolism transcriptional activator